MIAPRMPVGIRGTLHRPQPGDWLPERDPLAGDCDVALDDPGEWRSHFGFADMAHDGANGDEVAIHYFHVRREDAGSRADDQSFDGEECSPSNCVARCAEVALTHSMSLSSSSGVDTEMVRALSSVRLAMPVSTAPGPSSAKSLTPIRQGQQAVLPSHRALSWADSRLDHVVASVMGEANQRWRPPELRCRGGLHLRWPCANDLVPET